MTKSNFISQGSVISATVNEIQKEKIQNAILKAIENGTYYEGLETKACQAISNINRFSDQVSKNELVNSETKERFVQV